MKAIAAPVNTALAVGLMAVVMIIGMEKMHESNLEAAFDLGTENGKQLAQFEIKESLKKQVTDNVCMSWWFQGDKTRTAKAIQKVKLQ